ncbi:MAG: hypothetical protein Q8O64_03510 [Sideroxyarcus sp.]|nr:hypothetical protein [Sideroxyarcus sp.]
MTLQTFIDLINANGVVVSLVTFLLGLLLGHWLRIEGDKRKEFNEVALRIRVALKSSLSGDGHCHAGVKREDMELFSHLLRWWQRGGFTEAWALYEAECKNCQTQDPVYGSVVYQKTERLEKLLQDVISFTVLR